jgi:ABC-2 type transport system permease protein
MVGELVKLKARLTLNGLRADWQRRLGLPGAVALMILVARHLGTRYLTAASELSPESAAELALWAILTLWAGWIALPVVIFPLDENLDPARFASLPISLGRLVTGLGLSSLIAPSVVIPGVLLIVNLSTFPASAWPVGLVATLLLLGQMVVGGQLFTSAVSAMLRSRRGRDLAVFLVIGIGLFFFGAYRAIAGVVERLGLAQALHDHSVAGLSYLLPPVAAEQAMVEAAAGAWPAAVGNLLAALAWLGLLSLVWARLLAWMLTTPDSSPRPSRARRRAGLAGGGLWGIRPVVARKELRFYLRDPRQRLVWTGTVIFVGLAIAALVVGSEGMATFRRSYWLPLLAPVLVLFVGLPISLNQFGWERNAASYLFALPVRPRSLIQGKNLASSLAMVIETAFLTVLLAVLSGSWSVLPMVPALAVAAIGCQLAVGNLVSVLTPLRLPREGTDVFAQTTEQGCLAIVAQATSFFLIGLLLIPPSVATVLSVAFGRALQPWITIVFSIVWGAGLYLLSLWLSAFLLRRRVPEVVGWVQVY